MAYRAALDGVQRAENRSWDFGGRASLRAGRRDVVLHLAVHCTGTEGEQTCQPIANEGESCLGGLCAEGLVCDLGATNTCLPPLAEGAACSFLEYRGCDDGLFCDRGGEEETEGVCVP
jgi:hypothetical protein